MQAQGPWRLSPSWDNVVGDIGYPDCGDRFNTADWIMDRQRVPDPAYNWWSGHPPYIFQYVHAYPPAAHKDDHAAALYLTSAKVWSSRSKPPQVTVSTDKSPLTGPLAYVISKSRPSCHHPHGTACTYGHAVLMLSAGGNGREGGRQSRPFTRQLGR